MTWRSLATRPLLLLVAVLVALSAISVPIGMPIGRITEIAVYTLYGIGVAVLVSYTGLVPFGAAVFFGLASFATALSALHWFGHEPLAILFGVAFAAVLAAVLGLLVLRRRGLYFSLLTLACSQIAFELALRWTALTGGDNGIQNVPAPWLGRPWVLHGVVCVLLVAVAWLVWQVMHSPFGRALQGVRDNEQRAAALGFAPWGYKYGAFVLSGSVIGLAGCLHTYLIRGAYTTYLGWEHAGDPLLMLLVGGMHHILGALWGAITFIVLKDVISALYEHWWLIFAPAIMLFALAAPNGIHGLLFRLREGAWTLVRPRLPERPATIVPFRIESDGAMDVKPVLRIRGLCKRFGSVETARNLTFDVAPRRLHSVIGPNGAGKTTLFNLLSGQLPVDAGSIELLGRDVTGLPPHQRARLGLGRSFQIVNAFANLSAFENVRLAVQASAGREGRGFWGDAYDRAAINAKTWSALDLVGLADHAGTHCAQLPHGERRLLEIAMTVASNARVLLLDEPLAGLIESDRIRVSALIRRLADTHAVVLVEHDIDRVLALSDRISVLHRGALIADGSPEQVASDPQVIAAYIGKARTDAAALAAAADPAGGDRRDVLRLDNVSAGYEGSRVLESISLTVRDKEVVAVLGRNGVGKTTLLYTIMGAVQRLTGEISVNGRSTIGLTPFQVSRSGVAIVPEGRRLFGNLTVADNLRLAARPGGASIEEVFDLFPKLRVVYRRRAEHLSGGERQMVAIARSLMAPNDLILLDEPFEGLAPAVVQDVSAALERMKGRRSMVLVEHDAHMVMSLADRIYVLVNGRIAFSGTTAEFAADATLRESLLGVGRVEEKVVAG